MSVNDGALRLQVNLSVSFAPAVAKSKLLQSSNEQGQYQNSLWPLSSVQSWCPIRLSTCILLGPSIRYRYRKALPQRLTARESHRPDVLSASISLQFASHSFVLLLTRFLLLLIPLLPFPFPPSSLLSRRVPLTALLYLPLSSALALGDIKLSRPLLAGLTEQVSPSELSFITFSEQASRAAQLSLSSNPSLSLRASTLLPQKVAARWAVPLVVDSPETSLLVVHRSPV